MYFCRVKSNSIKYGKKNATVDSDVTLVLLSGMSIISGKCFERRLFYMADENSDDGQIIGKLSANRTRWRRLTIQQYVFEYVQGGLGRQWPSYFVFFRGNTFTHAQYINVMYVLDPTR